MLEYGASAGQVDEISRMGKSTILESLIRFCGAVESIYTAQYLRKPTNMDLQRLLKKGEMWVFPGMIESIDCMHWTWKNCPSAWQGAYGDRKGAKSIILEAVASFDTWIWHAFFGVPGAQNDLNILAQSLVFKDVLQGKAPKVTYFVNGCIYEETYYQGGKHLSKQCHVSEVQRKITFQAVKRGAGRMWSVVLVSSKLVGRSSGVLPECLI